MFFGNLVQILYFWENLWVIAKTSINKVGIANIEQI